MSILKSIANHPTMTSLNFGYSPSTKVLQAKSNNITDIGAKAISEFLITNKTLHRLDLRKNNITESGKQSLLAGLRQNNHLSKLFLDGKPDPEINLKLQQNQNLNCADVISPDIILIRSVYR